MNTFTFDKKTIKISFSKAASTYDTYSTLQKDAAKDLLKLREVMKFFHSNRGPYFVLDIGCGTGTLANSFKNRFPDVKLLGCDFSLPMLLKAKERLEGKNIRLLTSDCADLPFRDSLFNHAISSLTYQWVPDITNAFQEVWRILKPGGLFLFSIFGPRTLEELRTSYKKTEEAVGEKERLVFMEFHKRESLAVYLNKAGFNTLSIENVLKKKYYKNLWELLKTLKATGASPPFRNGKKGLARGLILKETAKNYQKYFPAACETGILATYDIVFAAARKI